ncbi:MAG: Ldh family oxidoreductase [Cytophagales bacterium]|nr:Ldh family oxidoreductase [Cytophagales bacterium]
MTVSYDTLYEFARSVFIKIGCPETDAALAAKVLVNADLRGIDSHGIARLIGYIRLYDKQRINATPAIKVEHETPSTAVINGDEGLGLVVGPQAMELAIAKAKNVGSGWVSVKNSNHFGIAGYHAMMALEDDCIGFAMTNASPLVSPTFANDRLLGTNPIAAAIPAGEELPFVLDMATTTAANGKLEVLQRKGDEAPAGWIQNKEGFSSTDPGDVKAGGSLLPLGGDKEHGSHKGYGLGGMVDILSAVLSGANYGPWVPPFVAFLDPPNDPVGQGIGHFFGALRVDGFRPVQEFKDHMDNWLKRFRSAKTVPGQEKVLVPGDPERAMEAHRRKHGIELLPAVVKDLNSLEERFGITL